jgi:hypothetical protein
MFDVKEPKYTGSPIEQSTRQIAEFTHRDYRFGWVTDIESDTLTCGFAGAVVRGIPVPALRGRLDTVVFDRYNTVEKDAPPRR